MNLSVIIPVLNEEVALPTTLAYVSKQRGIFETIVVDGGSSDSSIDVACSFSRVRLISSKQGRASQMNCGAAEARGEWLLFLHADTLLPEDALIDIISLTDDPSVQAGCFHHRFSGSRVSLSLISKLHNWRFSRGRIIYGDQAFFIRRSLFEQLGGFPGVDVMEDVLFSEKLVEVTRPVMLDKSVITDSRKFVQRGVFRSFFEVAIILICHQLKLPIQARGFFSAVR